MRPWQEGEAKRGDFRVIPHGADVVFKWREVIKTASESPFMPTVDDEMLLKLGSLDMHNTLLHGIFTGMAYQPGGSYELRASFTGQDDGLPLGALMLGLGQSSRRRSPDEHFLPLPDLKAVARSLERRLDKNKFKIETESEDEQDTIAIHRKDSDLVYLLKWKGGSPLAENAYFLDSKGNTDNPEAFEDHYNEFANIVEQIVWASYQTNRMQPPTRILEFTPPPDTLTTIKKIEKQLDMRKQTLGVAGMLDEELEAEIESKIAAFEKPTDTFDDIGGQEKAKQELKTLALSLVHPEAFKEEGTYPPRRILLYGPPGTGKTTLARALAHEANAGIMIVELADVIHALYGRSERFVQKMFEVARKRTPVILFFDELDALAAQRQHADQVISRIVNVLLTNLDGMKNRDDNVMVVGTTNFLEGIDRALLRPGRFDTLVELFLPNEQSRQEIFDIHRRLAERRAGRQDLFAEDLDLSDFVAKTEGYSGDDIQEIIKRTLRVRVRNRQEGKPVSPVKIDDLLLQVRAYESIRLAKEKRIGFVPSQPSQPR